MAVKRMGFSSFLFGALLLWLPFSYIEVGGIKLVLLVPVLFFLMLAASHGRLLRMGSVGVLFVPVIAVSSFFTIYSSSNELFAIAIFSFYLYSCVLIEGDKRAFDIGLKSYIAAAVFMAVGVSVQRMLYDFAGVEFGKIDHYGGGRTGFGFIWYDYSFLSLFLVSAIPLVFACNFKKYISAGVILVLLVGSVLTTARTGIAAFFISGAGLFFLVGLKLIATGRASKAAFFLMVALVVLALFFIYNYSALSNRDLTLSGSGRLEGFLSALRYFLDNPWLGAMFDRADYVTLHGTVPHNIFIYLATQGGLVLLLFVVIWLIFLGRVASKASMYVKGALAIAFIGLNFIPSFFNAYFFSALVSLMFLERRAYAE